MRAVEVDDLRLGVRRAVEDVRGVEIVGRIALADDVADDARREPFDASAVLHLHLHRLGRHDDLRGSAAWLIDEDRIDELLHFVLLEDEHRGALARVV